MKVFKISSAIILFGALLVYLVVMGGPFRKELKAGNCEAGYTYFLTNNRYCNWKTNGHCTENSTELYNAAREVANCLWIQYLSSGDEQNVKQIEELIKTDHRLAELWNEKSGLEHVAEHDTVIF